MDKIETLRDGSKVRIRYLKMDDLDSLMKFYLSLPPRDRNYLRVDVTDREQVRNRLKLLETGNITRITAFILNDIVADGALELSPEEWRKHQAELRVIVNRDYRRKGLGTILMRELYFLAVEKKVESIVAKMMRPQRAARKICRRLGFHDEVTIPDYVKDHTGHKQDLVVMTCNINEFWKELDHFYNLTDWRRCR